MTLAEERREVQRDDCIFYHTSVLRDGTVIDGPWDLRGHESQYLGTVDFRRKRVLECGPATGFLTYEMERRGADVIGFEVGYDLSIDLLPFERDDLRLKKIEHINQIIGPVQNSWWFMHREQNSRAKMVYGSIYDLPGDIGEFDIATLQAIMLHLRDPFSALEQVARRTRQCIIVTDVIDAAIEETGHDGMRFHPTRTFGNWTSWWSFSPASIVAMLDVLGFHKTRVSYHTQMNHVHHDMERAAVPIKMFTVVGEA